MKSIKKLAVLLVCWLFTSLSANVFAQTMISLNDSPGDLSAEVTDTITQLKLTGGPIDARDMKFLRDEMPNLAVLDLSDVTIVEYFGNEGTWPWGNQSYPANQMPTYSFYDGSNGKSSLTSVILPNEITSIGSSAFKSCSELTSVTIPASVISIVSQAFWGCSKLGSIDISGVTSFGEGVFGLTGLKSITIPDGVTSIAASMFSGCADLTSIVIPASVTSIGNDAFNNCVGLTSITIPDKVTSIGNWAFLSCRALTSITIPAGVSSIGDRAFASSGLTSITCLNPVPADISTNVFYGIDTLTCTLTVPTNSVDAYHNAPVWRAFSNISGGGYLLSVTVNNNALGSVNLPSGLYPLGSSIDLTATAASGFSLLEWTIGGTVILGNSLNFTLSQDTVITAVFGKGGTYNDITEGGLKNIPGIESVTHLTLTGTIDARDVKFMRDEMPNLTELDLSDVTIVAYTGDEGTWSGSGDAFYPANRIPEYSFYNGNTQTAKTSLTSVILPDGITSIGNDAFIHCSELTSVTIPASVTSIASQAFWGCSKLASIDISGVTFIGQGAFARTGLKSITIPNGVTSIEEQMFYLCADLTSINIPAGVTSIGNDAFSSCGKLTSINIPASVTSIGDRAFNGCNGLTSITIPDEVTSIGVEVFGSCNSLTSINIPDKVTSIGYAAFNGCSGLNSITLPAGVSSIGDVAFAGCSGLTSITCLNPVPVNNVPVDAFNGIDKSICTLTVPTNSVNAYQNAPVWSDFSSNISGGGYLLSVTVNNSAFGSVSGQTNGLYPENEPINLTPNPASTDFYFFKWTTGETVILDNSLSFLLSQDTVITAVFGKEGNYNITAGGLKNIPGIEFVTHLTLSDTIDARDVKFMRDNMPYLTEVDLSKATIKLYEGDEGTSSEWSSYPSNEIPEYAFCNYDWNIYVGTGKATLTSIILPGNITSIGRYAFNDCTGLTSINIPGGVISIGEYAFSNCTGLTSINIPDGITSIKYAVFSNCGKLNSITIPNSVTSIENWAFSTCRGLTSITIPAGVTSILDGAFNNCTGLASITIPAGVTSIGDYAFAYCTGLDTITNLNPKPVSIHSNVFENITPRSGCTLKVFSSSVSAYSEADVWKDFSIIGGGVSLSIAVNNTALGSVSGQTSGLYQANEFISLTANPATGFTFLGWKTGETVISDDNPLEFYLSQDTVITAVFGKTGVYHIFDAGTLKDKMPEIEFVTHLTLTGTIDARDVKFMRDSIPNLIELDLSGVTIKGYTGLGGTDPWENNYTTYPAGEIPEFSFCNYDQNTYQYTSKTTLTSVILPNGITSIGYGAFRGCTGLTSIDIPDRVTSIGNQAFMYCSRLTFVNLPSRVTSIGHDVFWECYELQNIDVSGVTSFGDGVFVNCSSLRTVTLSDKITSIPDQMFSGCSSLTSIDIPAGVTSIGSGAFRSCYGLTSITIPAGVTSIGGSAFNSCYGLASITIPAGVTSIGDYAFAYCTGLDTITNMNPEPVSINSNAFENVPINVPVYVPCGSVEAYQSAGGWNSFTNYTDFSLYHLYVQSNDDTKGTAEITQENNCKNDNTAVIEAKPASSNYRFVQWNDDNTENPRDVKVTADITYTAVFGESGKYHISVYSGNADRGTVTGEDDYILDTVITIEAIADSGYNFAYWNDGVTTNPRSVKVTSDSTFTATFIKADATLRSLTVSTGLLTPAFNASVTNYTVSTNADNITIDAVANDVDDATVSRTGGYTLSDGLNHLYIQVTAEDGSIGTYTVDVTREDVVLQAPFTEGFESSVSGWNIANGSQPNKWVLGTATAASGSSSVYISSDGINNVYDVNNPSTVHLYCDVSLPADSSYQLEFDWKGMGRYLRVYLADTLYNLEAGMLGYSYYDLGRYYGYDTWQHETWVIPTHYSGTTIRLVFTWVSSSSAGQQPPAAIDNVSITKRIANNDATLSSLWVTSGTLTFDPTVTEYRVQTITSDIIINASSNDNLASVSGSGRHNLESGENTIDVVVTADDGSTQQIYNVIVTRESNVIQAPFTHDFESSPSGLGWYYANGNYTNKWVWGTAADRTISVSNGSVYISSDNGINNVYNEYTSSVVHLFSDISFTSSLYQLDFDWKGMGEQYDYLQVYLVDPSFNPEAGANLRWYGYTPLGTYYGSADNWNHETLLLDNSYSGTTKRLVFTWENDYNNISQPPVAIDNVSVTERNVNHDATLSGLLVSPGLLTPVFDPAQTEYTVNTKADNITIYATPNVGATVNGTGAYTLNEGSNLVSISVIAEDGATTQSYTVNVIRENVVISTPFAHNFEESVSGWDVVNGAQINRWVWGTATAASGSKSVYISDDGTNNTYNISETSRVHLYSDVYFAPSDEEYYQLEFDWKGYGEGGWDYLQVSLVDTSDNLEAGTLLDNSLRNYSQFDTWQHATIELPASLYSDSTKRLVFSWRNDNVYGTQPPVAIDNVSITPLATSSSDATLRSLTVSEGELTPEFDANTTNYTVTVGYDVTSVYLEGTPNNSEADVYGNSLYGLNVGDNTATITVTSQDGTATMYYTVTIRRKSNDTTLRSLAVNPGTLEQTFYPGVTGYTVTVGSNVDSIEVTGTPAHSRATVSGTGLHALKTGYNDISVTVTAEDEGYDGAYVITVYRESGEASLSSLTTDEGVLTPAFNANTTNYTVKVAHSVTSLTLTGTAFDSNATVSGDGTVSSLDESDTVVVVRVTAEDPSVTKDYRVRIRRMSDISSLKALAVSDSILTPAFAPATYSYTVNVDTAVTSISITGTPAHDSATVVNVVNGRVAAGNNVFKVASISEDESDTTTYTVTVVRPASKDSKLRGITLSSGSLTPAFSAATTIYRVNAASSVTRISVTGTPNHALAKVSGNVTDATLIDNVVVRIRVVAEDDSDTTYYTVTVTRPVSTDATLSGIALSAGTLTPAFNADTVNYTVNVPNDTTHISATGTATHAYAKVSGNVNDSALVVGANVISITVTAEDGTTAKTYKVTVVRAASSDATLKALTVSSGTLTPAFNANTTVYRVNVPNDSARISVTGTANHALAKVAGNVADTAIAVGDNTVVITVTAADGTTGSYTVTVHRISNDASLRSIIAGSDTLALEAGKTGYTVNVANDVTSINVSGTANYALAKVSGNVRGKTLNVGNNEVEITVTAEDGVTTTTYTVTIVRAASSDATLRALTVSAGTLTPAFNASTTAYTVTVNSNVTGIDVAGIAGHASATVSGNVTGMTLETGDNTVTITVTAANGTASQTYTVTIHRVSSDATLSALTVSAETLTPAFDPSVTSYTVNVGSDVASIDVAGTANHSLATVSGNVTGKTLSVGDNEVAIRVTAEDGRATKTYRVKVIRADHVLETEAELVSFVGTEDEKVTVDGNTIEYAASCGETYLELELEASENATITVNDDEYVPGQRIDIKNDATVEINVKAEKGGADQDYTLTINAPIDNSKLYYKRWNDVIAINRNRATNGDVDVSNIRWRRPDGSIVENVDYIEVQDGTPASGYQAEVETGGSWRRVCQNGVIASGQIKIYPNPVPRGEKITVELPDAFAGSLLNIYSIQGSLVKSGQALPSTVNSIDMSEHNPGIYLLQISGGQGNREVIKIIIE